MRLPTRHTYRAFKALDRFTDAQCRRYVAHVRGRHRALLGLMLVVGMVLAILTMLLWGRMTGLTTVLLTLSFEDMPLRRHRILLLEVIESALYVGGPIFCGMLVLLVVRDMSLRWAILKHLGKASCHGCGYSLLGLSPVDGVMTCPECGFALELEVVGMTASDFLMRDQA